jgi:hypothetical protein
MYKLIQWNENLNLDEFYTEAARRGFDNNSSQKKMIDCLKNEREWAGWVLYQNEKAVGFVAAHSFDDIMGPNSYRICVRNCSFAEAVQRRSMITIKRVMTEHQNLTSQFFIPQCIEWCGRDKDLYITSNESSVGKQRAVHTIYFPTMVKSNIMTKVKDVHYRGTDQTVWKVNVDQFFNELNKYPKWS